jgi:thioesterase domain-containing protein
MSSVSGSADRATPPSLSRHDLEKFLHEKIPLTAAMKVTVAETSPRLVLEAPLAANINHLGSAFGGSLHALPTLACYAAVWMVLHEAGLDGHVVVKHSEASYRQPVKTVLRAVCPRPETKIAATFLEDLRRNKKARMNLDAFVEGTGGKPAVEFSGSFVALL